MVMSRRRKDALRVLTEEEVTVLKQIARAQSDPASRVARAKALLAVCAGHTYREAARAAGRKSNDAVSHLVVRFNREGLAAIVPRHGGGPPIRYGVAERERILTEARRTPDRQQDGTATWSLSTLRRCLRQTPDGLPAVSTYTLWSVLHGAGLSWQQSRTWCETGRVKRRRKGRVVDVIDPDAAPKKT
jgi:transposase